MNLKIMTDIFIFIIKNTYLYIIFFTGLETRG